MKQLYAALVILTSLFASNPAAWADQGYRIVPITSDDATELSFGDLNNRGEVVGTKGGAGGSRAFRWRNGEYTDLHDLISPSASLTQAAGINDWSTIVGSVFTDAFKDMYCAAPERLR